MTYFLFLICHPILFFPIFTVTFTFTIVLIYSEQLRQRLVRRTVNHNYQMNRMNIEQQTLKQKLFECSSLLRKSINFINYNNPNIQLPSYLVDIDFSQFNESDD